MDIFQQIDAIVESLRLPVTDEEKSCGWNEEYKTRVADFFIRQREALIEGRDIPRYGLIRALDFDGICSGRLLEHVAEVENAINAQA